MTEGQRRTLRVLLALSGLMTASTAMAEFLERIEINRINGVAEIRIGFSTQVQYLRHTPLAKGKTLNVFVRLVNAPMPEGEAVEETLTAPATDLVPAFTAIYPRLGGAVAIMFAQETSWDVKPGGDGRSFLVKVPILPGARDVIAEVRAVPSAAKPIVASEAVLPATPPVAAVATAIPAPSAPSQPLPTVPLPVPAPGPTPASVPVSSTAASTDVQADSVPTLTADQVESTAKSFFDDARKAVEEKDFARAINRLNRTLGLPNNTQTEAAQALIGEVREMNGEIAKARAEYELYLKLFPNGADAPRIKGRLAGLPRESARTASRAVPVQAGPAEWTYYGSVSQYYYTGKSHIEVVTPPPPGLLTFTTDVLSLTDQKALITNLDINARRRDGIRDTRIVLRDTDVQNFLNRDKSYNRLYSAYVEQSDRQAGYFLRAGRQTPTGGGVLERFDGVNVGYNFGDRWRINGVAGYPVEFMSPYKKDFYGLSLDLQAQPDQIGISTYVLQQHLEGVVNRQAVGLETRYFDMHSTVYGMLDYDVAFKGLNIAMLQGNYRSDDGTNYFTYLDHRKTPPYGLTNALPGIPGMSIKDAVTTMGIEQLRADARALTATSDMLAIGFTHPYSPRWMLGADYRAAAISSTQETATMPAMPGSGTNHVFSVQAIGNSIWTTNDVGVVNASYIRGANYTGQALGGNYVYLIGDAWRIDGSLRYYTQRDDQEQRQVRTSPALKFSYRWEPATIEAEVGAENVKVDGPLRNERSNRKYMFLGYRLDFR
jgi:hypothetical protein